MEELPLRVRILRRVNPLLAAILRSPLHGLMSRQILLVRYRGRKSGRTLETPLSYVLQAGVPHLVTRTSAWWRSVVEDPDLAVWLRGERRAAFARRLPAGSAEARAAYADFMKRNPGTATSLYGIRMADGVPDAADLARAIEESVVVRLELR